MDCEIATKIAPAIATEERRNCISDHPQIGDVDTDRRCELLVLLERLAELPHTRIDQPVHGRKQSPSRGSHEVEGEPGVLHSGEIRNDE